MKKAPMHKYEKDTGRMPIVAMLASESNLRKQRWLTHGCNAFDAKHPNSNPMSFWTEQDVLHYIKKNDVPYASVYGDLVTTNEGQIKGQIEACDILNDYSSTKLKMTGTDRTGCIFCMFGCHLEKEPNRFQRLKEMHPKQYEYCINGGEYVDREWLPNKKGLGLGHVLDYLGVEYK